MIFKLKESEAQYLSTILSSIPSSSIADEPKDKYRMLTIRKKILKEIDEKNSEFSKVSKKIEDITNKYRNDYNAFCAELDEAENLARLKKDIKELQSQLEIDPENIELSDKISQNTEILNGLSNEKEIAKRKYTEELNDKLLGEYDAEGVIVHNHFIVSRKVLILTIEYKDAARDKEIEIDLSDEFNHIGFIKRIIEEKALEYIPSLEREILLLGEKFGV